MTYFGYIDKEEASAVNWGQVGQDLSKILIDAGDARQAKRDAYDKATEEYQKVLNDSPSGDFKTANDFALNHANDAARYRLLQDRLFKNGVMNERQYTRSRQNLKDGTTQLFGLAKEYEAEYKDKMQRMKANESQYVEQWLMEQIEGLSNLKNSGSYINSESGMVSIGKLIKGQNPGDPSVLSKDPNDVLTVNQLRNRYKDQYNKFDVSATMNEEVQRLGSYITSVKDAGGPTFAGKITKFLDPTLRGTDLDERQTKIVNSFEKMEKDMINSYIEAVPLNALSVLTNTIITNPDTGKRFDLTLKPKPSKPDPNTIYLTDDGSGTIKPDLTEDQQKLVFDAVQVNFRNQLDAETTISTYNEPKETTTQTNERTQTTENENVVTNMGKLYFGTDEQVKEAEDYLRGVNTNIKSIDRSGESVIIEYNDGRASETLFFESTPGDDTTRLDQGAWITASANFFLDDKNKITDINKVISSSGVDLTEEFNKDSTGFSAGTIETEETTQEAFSRILDEDIDETRYDFNTKDADGKITGVIDDANGEAVKAFENKLPVGFTIEEDYKTGNDKDKFVSIKKGSKTIGEVDISKPGYSKEIKDLIIKNMSDEEGLITQATTVKNKGGKRKIKTTPRSTRTSSSNTTNNTRGVGSNYNQP
jgi:hypothetical protein